MKIDTSAYTFGPLHCSLESSLGDYYQNFGGAIGLVEAGYHGGLDERGIPLTRYDEQGSFYNAVLIAQYAIALHGSVLGGGQERSGRLQAQLDWLVEHQQQDGSYPGCWLMTHDNRKYPWLVAPWTSALASGNAISALLRGWELLGDERYRRAAELAYVGLHDPANELALEADGQLWYEEYPARQPMHVLNGHVYALLGVLDYARVTADPEAAGRWRRAAATLLAHLDEFDLGYWSCYDLRWREPVSLHYQENIHVPQLQIMARLTGEEPFSEMAGRWQSYADSRIARARWQVSLRTRRWHKRSVPTMLSGDELDAAQGTGTEAERVCSEPLVELRRFPYPYRAALTICNDPDLLTVDDFRRMNHFLSTDEETEWGRGLSLRLGGSFFMFRSPASPNVFTVFDRLTSTVTDAGEEILEWARQGTLDALHTYGCFMDPGDFRREMAKDAIDALSSHGVFLKTWVNHGPPTNVQCIGDHRGWHGDAVGTPGYHSDLTTDYGFRWFWTGIEMTDQIAMDAARMPSGVGRGLRDLRRTLRGSGDGHSELVGDLTLRDGRAVRQVFRYGGLAGRTPVLDDLPRQLSEANLETLVRSEGFAIVYQHLSVRRLRPGSGTGAYGPVDAKWFAPAELAALRRLSERHHAGDIWVAPTTALLRYRDAREKLRWDSRVGADGNEIVILDQPDVDDLTGITFYTATPETTRIMLETEGGGHRALSVAVNPADGSSRRSISVVGPERRNGH